MEAFSKAYPNLSKEARLRLGHRLSDRRLSQNEATALMMDLYNHGQSLLDPADVAEMARLYDRAMQTLDTADALFALKVTTSVKAGRPVSVGEQQRQNALIGEAFKRLPREEQDRYLDIQGRALELALMYPESARRAYESKFPQSAPLDLSGLPDSLKLKRAADLTLKALSTLSEKDRQRVLELQAKSAAGLSGEESIEYERLSGLMLGSLTNDEAAEYAWLADYLAHKRR